ncbi:MAG: hypothetical protein PHI34_01480 [Acidobacteriota bacterium]|nr:hypothetical protein [Acidobacteriota bacterium]
MIRRKATAAVPAVLVLAALGLASPAAAGDFSRFTIRLYGGPGYFFSGGDINEGMQGYTDYYNTIAGLSGFSVSGTFSPARIGPEAGADFIYHLTRTLGIGLGIGYINASRESAILFEYQSFDYSETQTARPAFGSIPLRIGVFGTIPVSPRMAVVLSGGPEIHFARASTFWELDEGTYSVTWENKTTGTGFGVFGAAALEYQLSRSIGLLLEVTGRYAKCGKLTGTLTISDGDFTEKTSGTLYRIEIPASGFPAVEVYDGTPDSELKPTQAKLDLSGCSVRLGVVISI